MKFRENAPKSLPVAGMDQHKQHIDKEKTFDFFGLPQELQDMVYTELAASHSSMNFLHPSVTGGACSYLAKYPAVQPRLVSRRFKEGYDKVTNKLEHRASAVAMFDAFLGDESFLGGEPGCISRRCGILEGATKAEVELDVTCSKDHRDRADRMDCCEPVIEFFEDELRERLPKLQDTTVRMTCAWKECTPDCLDAMIFELENVAGRARSINRVELYVGPGYYVGPGFEEDMYMFEDLRTLVAQWTRTGDLERFGEVEDYVDWITPDDPASDERPSIGSGDFPSHPDGSNESEMEAHPNTGSRNGGAETTATEATDVKV